MKDLTGRTVLVTGASKGIGASIAAALGAAGAYVIAHYGTDETGAREAMRGIPPERCLLVQADFSRPEAATGLWHEALAWRGRIDVLVNNAAVLVETPVEAPAEDWERVWSQTMQVNVRAPADLMREAVGHFREREAGVLVTISSWVAQRGAGNPHLLAYAASKGAVKALTQTLARAHAREGVLAYVIAPGIVATRMSVDAADQQGGAEAITAGLAMGEWVPPAEIADLVVFLAGGTTRHLTGATFDINGASYIR